MSSSESVDAVVDDGSIVRPWKTACALEDKYSKLPGIRTLQDFVAVTDPASGHAVLNV